MKQLLLNSYLILIIILSSAFMVFAQNNVKILNLIDNHTTSTSTNQSFYVGTLSNPLMQVTSYYTFEAWLYVDSYSVNEWSVIMDRQEVFSFYLIDKTSGGGHYRLRFVARNSSDAVIAEIRSDGLNGSTDYQMDLFTWYHVAVSRDGTTTRLFINGNLTDSSTDGDFVLSTPSGNPVNFGARYRSSYERFLDGAMDEIRYSDTSRYTSAFTISTNSLPHDTINDMNTILLFNFNDSSVTNSTSADSYTAYKHNSPFTYSDWDNFPANFLPLPVKYIDGLKAKFSDNKVILTWATASEKYNKGYELQHSIDNQNWDSINFISGAGNSNTIRKYSAIDNNPFNTNYYRLKQIDYNGLESFSNTEYLSLLQENNYSVFPNPASNILYINGINNNQIQEVIIYNTLGNEIIKVEVNNNSIDISTLKTGVYYIKIKNSGADFIVKRFIKG